MRRYCRAIRTLPYGKRNSRARAMAAHSLRNKCIAAPALCPRTICVEIAGLACAVNAVQLSISRSVAASGEYRRALVEKGAHAFGMVRGLGSLDLHVAFEIELAGEVVVAAFVERLFDQPERHGRPGREARHKRMGFLHQPDIIDNLPDHA